MDDNTPAGGTNPAPDTSSVYVRRLEALYKFTGRVMSFSSQEETARQLLKYSRENVASDYGTITFKDIEDNIYNIVDVAGKADLLKEVRKDPHAYITKQEGSSFWGGITRLVGETKKPYISNNVESDHERHYLKFWPDVKSNISVPILDERKNLIGILTLESKKINAYGKEDIDFLIHLSDLAALRMQTLEALEKKYKETQIWKSLTKIQREIGRFGLQGCKDILHGFLDLCLQQTRTKNGYFALVNAEKKCLDRFIYIGEDVLPEEQRPRVLQFGEGIDGKVAESGQPMRCDDVSASEDYRPFFSRIQSVLVVPLIYYDQVIGVLCMASKRMNAFSEKELQFAKEFAQDAAPTIRDAQFFDYTRSESGTGITIVGESRLMREMKEFAFQAASVSQELTILLRGGERHRQRILRPVHPL